MVDRFIVLDPIYKNNAYSTSAKHSRAYNYCTVKVKNIKRNKSINQKLCDYASVTDTHEFVRLPS